MNLKSRNIILKRLLSVSWVIFLAMTCFTSAIGQANLSGYKEVAKQRLLIRMTADYIYTVSQGQIDMDSSVRIQCKVYGLSPLLAYNEGYSDGTPSPGSRLLDAGKVEEARALLSNLHDEARLRLLIELGTYFVFKPGTEKADLDEASKYVSEASALSKSKSTQWKIEAMTLQAHLLDQSGRSNESRKIFDEVVNLCERSKNSLGAARTLVSAGELLPYGAPSRLADFKKALAIFSSQNAKEKEIETFSKIDVEYFATKRYDLSEQILKKTLKLQTEINFRHQQYADDALAFLAIRKGDLTGALSYSDKTLASLTSKADSVFISLFFTRRGILYQYLEKYKDAAVWIDKALENKTGETRLYWYKAFLAKVGMLNASHNGKEALSLLRETGSHFPPVTTFEKMHFSFLSGGAYENLKQFDLAEDNYKTFLAIAEKIPVEYVHDEFPDAFFQIVGFYRIIGKINKARELLDRGRTYTSKTDLARIGIYYYHLFKIDSIEKKYPEAINDLHLSQRFLDSASSYDQRKKVDELLVKYEDEKKDKNIKLLNSQNQLERIRVREADRTKNIILAGVGLLLVFIGLLANGYRIKQRSNRMLEANQRELDQKNVFLETMNTDLETMNTGQKKLLKEKEWLIKEVHHRVKNNLQIVISLLNSQSIYLEDDTAKRAFKDSLRRMQAMSLIHQKLYQDENTSTIAMPEYINDLVRYLHQSFDTDNHIAFEQTIEPLDLDVLQAIPLGLIITESIVNAIKYAFLNGQRGLISINLQQDGADHLLLKISDNGIGMPAGLDAREHSSMGLDLMRGLSKQLKGVFNLENKEGVHITVRFSILNK